MEVMQRRGVIAALLAAVLDRASGQSSTYPSGVIASNLTFEIRFQKGARLNELDCLNVQNSDGTVRRVCGAIQEPDHVLIVSYGDRQVTLTAAEIMDALEGR